MFKRAVLGTLLFLFVKSSMLFGAQAVSKPFIIADNVLGWPNVTHLPDGSILMAGFDKPSHGIVEGDVSCWISVDEGTTWQFQGKLTEHEPDTNRMNHAVGLTKDGRLVALVSGWSNVQQEGAPKRNVFRDKILSFWVCFSKDRGKTWTTMKDNSITDPYGRELIPFGDIILSDDGSLATVAYSTTCWGKTGPDGNLGDLAFMLVSKDDGQTWRVQSQLSDKSQNETALLQIADGHWLAASRGNGITLYNSDDDGQTWEDKKAVTAASQVPGHLLRLRDGRIMLTYGDRRPGNYGVGARISSDEGKTWSESAAIVSLPKSDLGYPASVELADGRILTVFYSSNPPEALKTEKKAGYAVYGVIWTTLQSSEQKVLCPEVKSPCADAMPAPIGLWTFNDPDHLTRAKIGQDLTLVGTHTIVPGVDAEDTAVRIGIGSHYICNHGINPTMSSGSLVNQWSLVIDFSYPKSSMGRWMSFFQTNQKNTNDADCFIRADSGTIGVDLTRYSSLKTQSDTWYRMVVSVDNEKSYKIYVDGALWLEGSVQPVDGRFAMGPELLLFADDNAEDNPMDISMAALYDRALSSVEAAALKGPGDRGIEQEEAILWTEPYLQNVNKDGITIMWELSDSADCILEYGLDSSYGSLAATASSSSGFGSWIYKSVLAVLKPNTTYHYRLTFDGKAQPDRTFKTAPAGSANFAFGVWGDSQGTNNGDYPNDPYQPTKAMMAHMADRVDIAVTQGDLATDGNRYSDTRSYYLDRVAKYLGVKVPWFVAWGNHDKGPNSVIRKFNDLPSKDRGGSFHPGYGSYSFEYGGCYFICIDNSDNRDLVWFENALRQAQANSARFIFVFVHQPPYCERWITGDQYGRDNLVPLMEKYNVDVCFSGHTHAYSRGYLNGVHYVITGGGSWLDRSEPLKTDWPHMTVGGHNDLAAGISGGLVHHYIHVQVDEEGFQASLVPFNPNGSVMEGVTDTFGKRKSRI